MTINQSFNNKTCALFLMDDKGNGLKDSRIYCGTLATDNDRLYFEKDENEGFPLPEGWTGKLFKTPVEKSSLFRGCAYFLHVTKEDLSKELDLFDIESRWECWCPTKQQPHQHEQEPA